MRTIGLRQFQQNLHKELADLPVTITRKGIPAYIITDVTANAEETTPSSLKRQDNTPVQAPFNSLEGFIRSYVRSDDPPSPIPEPFIGSFFKKRT